MQQENLPNGIIALVLSILSLIGCCFYGLPGLILAIIALYLANRDRKLYRSDPERYANYGQVKAARIISIIGLVLSAIFIILLVIFLAQYDFNPEKLQEAIKEMNEQLKRQQELQN